nr:lasso peptide biosynthesis B2 protein [uncultured Brevundimonas sp.]
MQTLASPEFGEALERGEFAETVHAAKLGSDMVLLDLSTDAYLLVPDCSRARIDGATLHAPMDLMLDLAANELLQSGPPTGRGRPPPPIPIHRLPDAAGAGPSLSDMAIFATLWADVARRRPTLQSLSRRLTGRRGRRDDLDAIAARVRLFRQLLPYAPTVGACLFQAELLLRFLNAAGLDADWVFGVRVWPFLAHCWLQVDDYCVSQSPDTLTIYRPIMAI